MARVKITFDIRCTVRDSANAVNHSASYIEDWFKEKASITQAIKNAFSSEGFDAHNIDIESVKVNAPWSKYPSKVQRILKSVEIQSTHSEE